MHPDAPPKPIIDTALYERGCHHAGRDAQRGLPKRILSQYPPSYAHGYRRTYAAIALEHARTAARPTSRPLTPRDRVLYKDFATDDIHIATFICFTDKDHRYAIVKIIASPDDAVNPLAPGDLITVPTPSLSPTKFNLTLPSTTEFTNTLPPPKQPHPINSRNALPSTNAGTTR